MWTKIARAYVHLVLDRALVPKEFENLSDIADKFFGGEFANQIIFMVIDRLPKTSDLHQIFALHAEKGLNIVPLSMSLITHATRDGREAQYLMERVDLFTGRTNHYDTRSEVSDLLSFFGRHALLADLKQKLASGTSVMIFGV